MRHIPGVLFSLWLLNLQCLGHLVQVGCAVSTVNSLLVNTAPGKRGVTSQEHMSRVTRYMRSPWYLQLLDAWKVLRLGLPIHLFSRTCFMCPTIPTADYWVPALSPAVPSTERALPPSCFPLDPETL